MALAQGVQSAIGGAAVEGIAKFEDTLFDLEKENHMGIFSNMTLLNLLLITLTEGRDLLKGKDHFNEEYDYIIVGGGTAGSVMANRLSETCASVLLLEAGGLPLILSELPAIARLLLNSSMDWADKTTPQKYAALGHDNQQVILNSGKVLGGGSTINAMLYVRANPQNYDDWAAGGATGWSWNEVRDYFLKLEDNHNLDRVDAGYHRKGGPMTAEKIHYKPEIKDAILKATDDMGYKERDINGRSQIGIYELQATVRNQQRCSTAKAYLEPAAKRKNLDILIEAFVRRVLIDPETKEAYGVEFDHLEKTHTVKARKEVILCNGALRTPQLLILSGVGPKKDLDKLRIPVIQDSPYVGKNLQDHSASNLVFHESPTIVEFIAKCLEPTSIAEYLAARHGPICAPFQCTLMAFLKSLNPELTAGHSENNPEIELYFAEYATIDARLKNLRHEEFETIFGPHQGKPLYICYSSLLQPFSRGEVTLKSADPYDPPLINPNYFSDPRDVDIIVEGLKICKRVAEHPEMKKVGAEILETMFSGFDDCKKWDPENEETDYLRCYVRHLTNTFWHPVGTTKMGSRDDPTSVVDPELKLIGVSNLRVVSAAIMPLLTSGNTNVPTMMIAEKASDMIKSDINCNNRNADPHPHPKPKHNPADSGISDFFDMFLG